MLAEACVCVGVGGVGCLSGAKIGRRGVLVSKKRMSVRAILDGVE